jgi:hypothetical protein
MKIIAQTKKEKIKALQIITNGKAIDLGSYWNWVFTWLHFT